MSWDELARYNSERARGIVHTAEWQAKMAHEQDRFQQEQEARFIAMGGEKLSHGAWLLPAPKRKRGRWWR